MQYFFDFSFFPKDNTIINFLIKEYLPGLWNSLVNVLMYLIFDKISKNRSNIGLWSNYTEYMSKEIFINRVSFIYLLINIVFVPMFSLAAGQDIINLAESVLLWKAYNKIFLLSDSCRIIIYVATFYYTIILINSSLGFLNVLDRLTDLFNECGSLRNIDKFYHGVRNRTWLKRETYIFQYGYYYALSTTLITATGIYGIYMPFLFFACTFFLLTKSLSDGVTFICIYGKDVQGSGRLFESNLRKLHIGVILAHLILMNRCYWDKNILAFGINTVIAILSTILNMLMNNWSVTDFKNIVYAMPGVHDDGKPLEIEVIKVGNTERQANPQKIGSDMNLTDFIKPSLNDKADWVYMHTHPFIKKTSYCAEYIEHFNEPLGVPPSELRIENPEARIRFENWLNKRFLSKDVANAHMHARSGDPKVNLPANTEKIRFLKTDLRAPQTSISAEQHKALKRPLEEDEGPLKNIAILTPLTPLTRQKLLISDKDVKSAWQKGNLKRLVENGIYFESVREMPAKQQKPKLSTNIEIFPDCSEISP